MMNTTEANRRLLEKRRLNETHDPMGKPDTDDALDLSRLKVVPDSVAETLRRQAPEVVAAIAEAARAANLPKRHLACDVDRSGRWGEAEASLRERLGTGCTLALIGGNGPGKTQMAVELAKDAMRAGSKAHYTTAVEMIMHFKEAYNPNSKETERVIMAQYRRYGLLVIDEYHEKRETDWERQILFELINKRYADMTDTILISNLAASGMAGIVGPSINDRMREGGGIIECNWPSFRTKPNTPQPTAC